MSRITKVLIAAVGILAIAACLWFIVTGPRPADPEGLRARVRGFFGMRDNRGDADYIRRKEIRRCQDNLVQLETYKFMWASENQTTNDTPTWDDLRQFFPDHWSNGIPVCLAGGTYTIGRVGEKPRCSVGGDGHSLRP